MDRAAAFDALVAEHTEKLCRFVYRYVQSRETAEDIVQELFVSVWEMGSAWDAVNPVPYLYKAARNRAISHARKQVVRDAHEASVVAEGERFAPADTEAEESELAAAVSRAVASLPEKCRLVFTMSREQGLSHAEIAEALGLSTKTVEAHIWRALKTLRGALAPYLVLVLGMSPR